MPTQCPTCSRVNPPNAAYCYYDGRGLTAAGPQGPLGLGTLPFPLPFSFADGHGCSTYNQLVLACDRRWGEARGYLANGTWKSFFSTIGRADLAALANQSANQPDADDALCHLLERLPADAEALRPAKLGLPSPVEDLGALEPGKDYKVEVVIENQGMLLLRGSARTDCDWLAVGDAQGYAATKLFQTRDTYTLAVRVLGGKLRAGKKPLEGQIVIDTNGGRQAVTVRALVPIRPFPAGPDGNNVLAGAQSSREIAVKAKAHPNEAAVLFEQGVVKAWYETNGWAYPIRGTQARGKGALQQFFEALGLTKPPRLEINTEQIVCQGEAGTVLTKKVIVRTAEAKIVHAAAQSNQDWIKVLPAVPHGNSVTIPLRIEVPPRPGETLQATVTFQGNGLQQFVVPATLSVAAKTAEEEEQEAATRGRWLAWGVGGSVVALALAVAIVLVVRHRPSEAAGPPPDKPNDQQVNQGPTVEHWWDDIPGTTLTASVRELKKAAGKDRPIFERVEGKSEIDRGKGYEELAAKLPELARDPATRPALGRFVAECCVYEPSLLNITPLLRGLARQLPAEDKAFAPGDVGEGVEQAAFWLAVVCDAITHKGAKPDRKRRLTRELENVLGADLDAGASPEEFKGRAEKALAEQCYRDLLPTAEKSVEQALAVREALIARFPRPLGPDFCDQEDVKLLDLGLSRGGELWPKLGPLFRACVASKKLHVGVKLVELYEKAGAELAPKMEALLAARWKVLRQPKLTRAARAGAIRRGLVAAGIPAKVRLDQLRELLAKTPLSAGKPGVGPGTTPLQDVVRLSHASTMACLLLSKEDELARFDELIGRIPGAEPEKVVEAPGPETPPRPAADGVIDLAAGNWLRNDELTGKSDLDPRRGAYRKIYSVRLKAGEIYVLDMRSSNFTPYLRVESATGARLAQGRGANTHIIYSPPGDRVYHVVASSLRKNAVGRFTVQIARQQIIRYGFPGAPPGMLPPGTAPAPSPSPAEEKAPPVNLSDLRDLGNKQGRTRIAAFTNLARSLPDDLPYRQAQLIATYLLVTEWDPPAPELETVKGQLPSLGKCRRLLEALADVLARGDKLARPRAEAVVGGLLGKPLDFAPDDDWRSACRKLLLQRALGLTGRPSKEADKAADFLRDLYKEQGRAFGLEDPGFEGQTRLSAVLEQLIPHVAAAAARGKPAPADKTYLEQAGRQVQAVRFAASNDLAYTVQLQRIWIKVLVLALKERVPARVENMTAVLRELDKKDRGAGNLLEQLRSGEENILRVWVLAHDLKPKGL